jgi:hypothetical protein
MTKQYQGLLFVGGSYANGTIRRRRKEERVESEDRE